MLLLHLCECSDSSPGDTGEFQISFAPFWHNWEFLAMQTSHLRVSVRKCELRICKAGRDWTTSHLWSSGCFCEVVWYHNCETWVTFVTLVSGGTTSLLRSLVRFCKGLVLPKCKGLVVFPTSMAQTLFTFVNVATVNKSWQLRYLQLGKRFEYRGLAHDTPSQPSSTPTRCTGHKREGHCPYSLPTW